MRFLTFILLLTASVFLADSMSLFLETKMTDWDNLKVTWGINPFSSQYFVSMPLTEADARAKGWTKEKSCSQVNGNRYMFAGDRAVMLIYNVVGDIVGISTAIPKGLPFNFPSPSIQKFFKDEGESYTISAYFTDPDTVCSPTLARKPLGDRVTIQGTQFQMDLPLSESQVDSFWTLGQCFWTMGVHYWADISGKQIGLKTNPDDFVPMFLQFNKGRLNGFGWGFNANLTSSRYEHPTPDVLGNFFKEVPNFFSDPSKSDSISTLHIYLDSTPQLNRC